MPLTPAMKQYYDLKKEHPDCLLFFRMWDFYEMFDDDAMIAHKILWIAITTRNKNSDTPTPLAGIPFHAKEKYLPLLVQAGYKIAIAEQITPPWKWIVERKIVRVVTPATLSLEWEEYDSNRNSGTIVALSQEEDIYKISIINLSVNTWQNGETNNFSDIVNQIQKHTPDEILVPKKLYNNNASIQDIISSYPSACFSQTQDGNIAVEKMIEQYLEKNQKQNLDFLPKQTQINFYDTLQLDDATIRSLDLVYNIATKSSTLGTLFGVLKETKTTNGAHLLQKEILSPKQDISEIKLRQDFIQELMNNKQLLESIRSELSIVWNMYTILNRLSLNRWTPKDLLQLKSTLIAYKNIYNLIKEKGSSKLIQIIN